MLDNPALPASSSAVILIRLMPIPIPTAITGEESHDRAELRDPRPAEVDQHGHADELPLQARPAQPVHPGRAAAQPECGDDGRRGIHLALHAGARGPQPDDGVPEPGPPAAQGGRAVPARGGAGDGQPQGCARRVGGLDPDLAPDGARCRRRGDRWRLSRLGRDRAAGDADLPQPPVGADQPDPAPGDRHQRADRLRRRAGVPGRRDRRRRRRRGGDPGSSRRGDRRSRPSA